jgi:hypothetical protein
MQKVQSVERFGFRAEIYHLSHGHYKVRFFRMDEELPLFEKDEETDTWQALLPRIERKLKVYQRTIATNLGRPA